MGAGGNPKCVSPFRNSDAVEILCRSQCAGSVGSAISGRTNFVLGGVPATSVVEGL